MDQAQVDCSASGSDIFQKRVFDGSLPRALSSRTVVLSTCCAAAVAPWCIQATWFGHACVICPTLAHRFQGSSSRAAAAGQTGPLRGSAGASRLRSHHGDVRLLKIQTKSNGGEPAGSGAALQQRGASAELAVGCSRCGRGQQVSPGVLGGRSHLHGASKPAGGAQRPQLLCCSLWQAVAAAP